MRVVSKIVLTIILIGVALLLFVVVLVVAGSNDIFRYTGFFQPGPDPRVLIRDECFAVKKLREIYGLQELFKSQKVKDQNHNGIGEYGTTDELIKYLLEKENKIELTKMGLMELATDFVVGKEGNIVYDGAHVYRVFIPSTVDEQERYWLCFAIPPPGLWRERTWEQSYFLDNKRDIIFYAENDSLKKLKLSAKDQDDPWSLKRIFWGEPFKSPIDTSIWKILDSSHLIGERLRYTDLPNDEKEPDKPK